MSIKRDALHNAQQLLFQDFHNYQSERSAPEKILVIEDPTGYVVRQVSSLFPEAQIDLYLKDFRRAKALDEQLASNANVYVQYGVFPNVQDCYDAALLTVPKGRYYTRKHFASARESLKGGSPLLLVGQTQLGAKSIIKDAMQYFGSGETLTIKKHCRVGICFKEAQKKVTRWQEMPGLVKDTYHTFDLTYNHCVTKHHTLPGVFSWEHLDAGTEMLLDHMNVKPEMRIWDIGCGSGVIGLAAASMCATKVYMSDIDMLALSCTWKNASNQLLHDVIEIGAADATKRFYSACLVKDDIYPQLKFDFEKPVQIRDVDLIVSNPPFHQGHEQNLEMMRNLLENAKSCLAPSGRILIVANTFLPYSKMFKQTGYQSKILERTPSFSVHEAKML